ncbi:radical SAM/SPASM domain-containing protein [Noviherbaspirillum suwonense]|uniref:Radical SAM core domain-containing protein n=1 Tax=Noviherbaspirillum suwonense TaxID=1224511 RepID=A0ABY1Q435_9BURK|nr:radical SAM protein [Noviherbaspirillum suwonense]SMP54425.1 uncharacterized protein SAMN06295970_10411 [Noviherbaspirillum suwonense]
MLNEHPVIRVRKASKEELQTSQSVNSCKSRHAHWQRYGGQGQLLVVNGTQLFDVDDEILDRLDVAAQNGDQAVEDVLRNLNLLTPPLITDEPLTNPKLRALSLAVAQKCNMGCSYCYASQGNFGSDDKSMTWDTARRAVDLLFEDIKAGENVNLAFLGGEPLFNRVVIQAVTKYAANLAEKRGVKAGFSLTTNGTLLNDNDASFFEEYGFAVTISLDGLKEEHDKRRTFKNGKGSFDQIIKRVEPLLSLQNRMQVSVRATVCPGNTRLKEAVNNFLDVGFHSVGLSPVLHSPDGIGEMTQADFDQLLAEMIDCGHEFELRTLRGNQYAFSNIINALNEIHRGTHRPYPCGAGAGYLGVSADGNLAACHRFVGDPIGKMGSLEDGIDETKRNIWLATRHVHKQMPCTNCWARYLCSGGCHHEVIARGRPACDFIRGWLEYCLQAYGRLSSLQPDWFNYPSR